MVPPKMIKNRAKEKVLDFFVGRFLLKPTSLPDEELGRLQEPMFCPVAKPC